jgi:hypothetical protein
MQKEPKMNLLKSESEMSCYEKTELSEEDETG